MALAIECGASTSVAVYVDEHDKTEINLEKTTRYHFGPANYKLLKPIQLEIYFRKIKATIEPNNVTALAVAMPGVLNDTDKKMLKNVLSKVWTNLSRPIWVGNDLESSMARLPSKDYIIRSVAISGTGSCCYGTDGVRTKKIGGYGHVIGDRGSGYAIAYRGLRLALRDYEHNYDNSEAYSGVCINGNSQQHINFTELDEECASKTSLLKLFLSYLNMVAIYELVSWSVVASKNEIADLAKIVIRAAECGNSIALMVIEEATNEIADDIVCLINKLKGGRNIPDKRICIGLTGSVFVRSKTFFTESFIQKIRQKGCLADVIIIKDTVLGALKMVIDIGERRLAELRIKEYSASAENEHVNDETVSSNSLRDQILPISTGLSETEKRNSRSMKLCSMPIAEAVELMIDEESRSNRILKEHVSSFVTLIKRITNAFQNGGRLFYVGAGTSGRLGILDASECPPTFKAPPHWVQGIIAGGTKAIQSAIEGAEDSLEDGIDSIIEKDVCDKDVVIGIAACGRTPFVWGALYESLRRDAYSCLLTFNPNLKSQLELNQIISVNTGPEVLTGSTRLKAGTATKCILNILTTLSMVAYGKCLENLMVDLMPLNEKLRDRAIRITLLLVDDPTLTMDKAEATLIKNHYDIKKSVTELRKVTVKC